MNKDKYDWNKLSIELSKLVHQATDEQLMQMVHKILREYNYRNNVDWRLNG